jgi:hypothetical protein
VGGMIGSGKAGIEAFCRKVGNLRRVVAFGKGDPFRKLAGNAMGERFCVGVRDNNERMHA